jgi:MFS family permease
MGSRRPAAHRRRLGRAFHRLWFGFALASSGDGLTYGAVPLLAVFVNPHPLAVSAVVAADSLPWILMALPAGHFADRFERGPVAALSNALRALVILLSAFLILSDRMTWGLLLVVVLINASGRAFFYSSFQATVPDIIQNRDLEHANGIVTATEAGVENLAGPVVGTSLFAMGKSLPFFADAVVLALSCLPFLKFRSRAEPSATTSTSMWEGVRLLFGDKRLRTLTTMVGCLALLQGMEFGVLVLLATTKWGVGEGAYGFFLAAGAAGNLIGSILADGRVRRFGSGRTLIGAAVLSGLGYLFMAAAQSWTLAAPAFVIVGIAVGVGAVVANSLRQRLTPHELMGRVGGASRGIVWGVAPLGSFAAGVLATFSGLRTPLIVAGVLQCVVALLLARPLLRSIQEGRRREARAQRRSRFSDEPSNTEQKPASNVLKTP